MAFPRNINGTNDKIGMAGVPQNTTWADQQDDAANPNTGLFPADHAFFQAYALDNFYSDIDPVRYAKMATIPNNTSKVMTIWGFNDIGPISAPLTEGETPDPQYLSMFRRDIPVQHYGAGFLFTDEQLKFGKKEAFAQGAKACGQQAKLTEKQICYGVMMGGTGAMYGGTGNLTTADVDAGDVITGDLLATALDTLIKNYAKKQTTVGKGSTNTDTLTTDAGFFMIAPFAMKAAFENLTPDVAGNKFIPLRQYAAHQSTEPGELGSFKECRIILDTEMPILENAGTGGLIDVYTPVIWGKDAFTMAYIGPSNAEIITMGLGSAGTEDMIKQRATQAWKFTMGGGILYENHMVRLEVALT